ncbi:MAG: DUF1566 domain-containing protein [Ramlibacter sp.]
MSETATTPTPAASPVAAQPITTHLRTLSAPAIGTHWVEQGGIYAGIVRSGADGKGDYHLIVAPGAEGQFEGLAWGPYGKRTPGADSMSDGLANTQAMLAASDEHPAAQVMPLLQLNGHADWYLPAIGELRLIHTNTPEICSKDGWYWSSTQYSPGYAWVQDFEYGDSVINRKTSERRAVAVRRLVI